MDFLTVACKGATREPRSRPWSISGVDLGCTVEKLKQDRNVANLLFLRSRRELARVGDPKQSFPTGYTNIWRAALFNKKTVICYYRTSDGKQTPCDSTPVEHLEGDTLEIGGKQTLELGQRIEVVEAILGKPDLSMFAADFYFQGKSCLFIQYQNDKVLVFYLYPRDVFDRPDN